MRIDLHMHSTASDGELPPGELMLRARAAGLGLVALTDHDSAEGVPDATKAAAEVGLAVVPASELSSTWEGRDVHILGYGIDPEAAAIVTRGRTARRRRRARMVTMVDRLREAGVAVGMADVERAAGRGRVMIGRPHLARALVDVGAAASVVEAFDTLIGDGHPAFVPTDLGSPRDAIEAVIAAGGIPVWAHPPGDQLRTLLATLVEAGLQGLEAYRAGWSARRSRQVVHAAREHGLCVTGGSDWHGPDRGGGLGDFWVTPRRIRAFLDLLGDRVDLPPGTH